MPVEQAHPRSMDANMDASNTPPRVPDGGSHPVPNSEAPESETSGQVKVMIIGKPGSGKSTLGNKLLGSKIFSQGGGAQGVTTSVTVGQSKAIKVIDTPGIPDPKDADNPTIDNFNAVVEETRNQGELNALIFMIHQERTFPSDFGIYRILLEEFRLLPCAQIMVCRQPRFCERPDEDSIMRKKDEGLQFAQNVQEQAGLPRMPIFLLIDGFDKISKEQLGTIAQAVKSFPLTKISPSFLKTFPEIVATFRELSDANTRMEAVAKRINELNAAKANHKQQSDTYTVLPSLVEMGAGVFVAGVVGAIGVMSYSYFSAARRRQAMKSIQEEIESLKQELHSGKVNPNNLLRAQKRMEDIMCLDPVRTCSEPVSKTS